VKPHNGFFEQKSDQRDASNDVLSVTDVLIYEVPYVSIAFNVIVCSSNEPMLTFWSYKNAQWLPEQRCGQRDIGDNSISVDNDPVQKVSCVSVDDTVVLLSIASRY